MNKWSRIEPLARLCITLCIITIYTFTVSAHDELSNVSKVRPAKHQL